MNEPIYSQKNGSRYWIICLAVLSGALCWLFHKSFHPDYVHHANDGPLGSISADAASLPGTFTGFWMDLNWIGNPFPSATPNISVGIDLLTGPVMFAKFWVPISLLLLGFSGWCFFRCLNFPKMVSLLGALAAALNTNMFSNACWGQCSRPLSLATTFFALAAIQSGVFSRPLFKSLVAGLAVGIGVMEGYDIGALFSIYVAAFAMFVHLIQKGPVWGRLVNGGLNTLLIAVFAGMVAAHALISLVGTQIVGIAGTEQTQEARKARWDFATQWSLPKTETLRVIVPGLFGYRLDTPGGGQYWGTSGRQPGWEQHHSGFSRHTGSGEYAGVAVVLLALFAAVQACRRKDGPFSDYERKLIQFWIAAALVSLLLAWGRYAPFYELIYQLPYFSTIRNPVKFMHPFHLCILVLFGYGLTALWRRHVEPALPRAASFGQHWKKWWSAAPVFDRMWVFGLGAATAVCFLGWLVYMRNENALLRWMSNNDVSSQLAPMTTSFSFRETALFLLFLALSSAAVVAIMTGWFSGAKARWAGMLLGCVLMVDLVRANQPWIVYFDYKDKYATNPIIEFLRNRPHESRVTMLPLNHPDVGLLQQLYNLEWAQHHFLFYNIQSVDIIQMSREPVDYAAYRGGTEGVFAQHKIQLQPRYWELTNTRYILGLASLADAMNQQLDGGRKRFRIHTRFDLAPKPDRNGKVERMEDITAVPNPNGRYALIEFTGALPRAALYSNWMTATNDAMVLEQLPKPEFDPHKTVIVSQDEGRTVPAPEAGATNAVSGKVEFVSYAPKHIELRAECGVNPSILLLNDRFHPDWKVWVDGQPQALLRCNYVMRGVHLPPGTHRITFKFQPPLKSLYVSLASIGVGLLLCGYLIVVSRRRPVVAAAE